MRGSSGCSRRHPNCAADQGERDREQGSDEPQLGDVVPALDVEMTLDHHAALTGSVAGVAKMPKKSFALTMPPVASEIATMCWRRGIRVPAAYRVTETSDSPKRDAKSSVLILFSER